ncbi:MAG: flavoprotein [Deltaproteobacteria bacterium]|nr:flavoprotein [Deltaproteobacteria bacterium]
MKTEVIDAGSIARYDDEVDVLVVGLGAAGAATALSAVEVGATPLVVERAGGGGGTSAMSGGVMYLGGGTALQKACGFEDTSEEMLKYLQASIGAGRDDEKLNLYCDGTVEHFDWLVARGVPYKETFYHGQSGEPPTDDGLVWSGSENVHPFREIAKPAPRGHVAAVPGAAGHKVMSVLCKAVEDSGAKVAYNTVCTALYREHDGAITGARLTTFGEVRNVRARGGVVITTGGFVLNDDMLEVCRPEAKKCSLRVAADGDDGSGIRLGQAAGAGTRHLDKISVSLPVTQPWDLKAGLLVNEQGQRFINEDAYYGRLGDYALLRQNGRCWLIVDDAFYVEPEYGFDLAAVAETPAELGRELGMPEGALESTIELFNRYAARGEDPLFGKREPYLRVLETAPFAAVDCTTDNARYAVFTLGGLATDIDGQVLDPEGRVIPGLYGAGRSTSGLAVGGYSSGLSLGDGTFFGRRAGRTAASRGRR